MRLRIPKHESEHDSKCDWGSVRVGVLYTSSEREIIQSSRVNINTV